MYFFFRYHKKCKFSDRRGFHKAETAVQSSAKENIDYIVRTIRNDPDKNWNSSELHAIYLSREGTETNVTRFLNIINELMKDEIYLFKSPGLATIIVHKTKAATTFRLAFNTETEDVHTETVAKQILSEVKNTPSHLKQHYPTLNLESSLESCSPTLMNLLSLISPGLHNTQKAALIGNIVTSEVTSGTSMLQVALGLLVREKKLIEHLHEYGVVASYDEVRRLKISAATISNSPIMDRSLDTKQGLIQGISDNFDANLCTQNGLKQTHSLATIITQHPATENSSIRQPIPRLKKEKLSSVKIEDIKMQNHTGLKKPMMSARYASRGILPLKVLCHQAIIVKCSQENDFDFIKLSLTSEDVPDFNGFNMKKARVSEVKYFVQTTDKQNSN